MCDETMLVWLTLLATPGIGLRSARMIIEQCKRIDAHPTLSVLQEVLPMLKADLQIQLVETMQQKNGQRDFEQLKVMPYTVLCEDDDNYPQALLEISDPPPFLTVLGKPLDPYRPAVAIVGTRQCSAYGQRAAREIAEDLVKDGFAILSGLAIGIDQAAHQGAVNAHGKTVAILGSGLQKIYPQNSTRLVDKILAEGGAVYSEFLPWQQAQKYQFVQRNRIISGMGQAVIVVEASARSGALITADFALSQNRDVAVVPGSLYGNSSLGCHFLANQGAFLLVATDHVAKQLALRGIVDPEERKALTRNQPSSFCQTILTQLMINRKSIDQLTRVFEEKGWKEEELWQALFELESAGEIVRIGPGLYSR